MPDLEGYKAGRLIALREALGSPVAGWECARCGALVIEWQIHDRFHDVIGSATTHVR